MNRESPRVPPSCDAASSSTRFSLILLTLIYLLALAELTLTPHGNRGVRPINLNPGHMMTLFWEIGGLQAVVNLWGNLVVFVPLGWLWPLLACGTRWASWWGTLMVGFVLSTIIEVSQWGLGTRVADIDDVLLNTAGAGLGHASRSLVLKLATWCSRPKASTSEFL